MNGTIVNRFVEIMKPNLIISLFLVFLLLNSLTIFLIVPLFPAEAADHEITESLPNLSNQMVTYIGQSLSRTNPGEKNSGGQDCDLIAGTNFAGNGGSPWFLDGCNTG